MDTMLRVRCGAPTPLLAMELLSNWESLPSVPKTESAGATSLGWYLTMFSLRWPSSASGGVIDLVRDLEDLPSNGTLGSSGAGTSAGVDVASDAGIWSNCNN